MNINQVEKSIRLARKHVHEGTMNSSVRHCLAEALEAQEREDYDVAHMWACKSLAYSVGICHPDYKAASK